MDFMMNFPFITIVLSLFSSVIAYALKGKQARFVSYSLLGICSLLHLGVLFYNLTGDGYFVYRMGHYDAPIGNEISAGLLEPFFALLFSLVMLFSLLGGAKRIFSDLEEEKYKLFYVMVNLVHAALAALAYTNDIFTGYVFIEICTIASCALLMARSHGKSLVAATRYMIFSLMGSGLVLIGIILLYSITGHLLFPQMYQSVQSLWTSGEYRIPLTVAIGLLVSGLAIKSGLFPFHFWMPDTYGTATPAASAILSGVVSKGYIFFLLKLVFRVIGFEVFVSSGIQSVLFALGILGMIFGSVSAIRTNNINFMIAFSSAAQIGYIYMGLGLGTKEAVISLLFQILAHALAKPMLFLAASKLSDTASGAQDFASLHSSAHDHLFAGLGYSVGALSMVGIPIFVGFVPKLFFAMAAFGHGLQTYCVLIALAISTILNVVYFLRTLINIYSPPTRKVTRRHFVFQTDRLFCVVMVLMLVVNVALGLCSQPVVNLFDAGFDLFLFVR